jgi:fructokinase
MRIGLDLGGTKIEGIALDGTAPSSAGGGYRRPATTTTGTLHAMADLVRDLEATTGRRATVGVGMPGALSPATGLVKNANSTWLIGRALDRDLSAAPRAAGALRQRRQLLRPLRGGGRGGGGGSRRLRRDRGHRHRRRRRGGPAGAHRAERDRRRVGPQPAPLAARGRVAGAGLLLRQDGLRRDVPVRARPRPRPPAGRAGTTSAPEIVARAERGEARAGAALGRYEERMAGRSPSSSTSSTPTWSCWAAACRGSPASTRTCPRLWQEWAFSDRVDTPLRPPVHGDSSGVRGAAWLWGPGGGEPRKRRSAQRK